MGIQINGLDDTISATDGSLSVAGQQLTDVTDINASGIGTFTNGLNVGTGASVFSPATNVLALGTNSAERIRITSSGEVQVKGENAAAGQTPLSVQGNYAASGNVDIQTWARSGGAVAAAMRYVDADTLLKFGTTTDHGFGFLTNGSERLRVTSGGLVGIGTNSPQDDLHVMGEVRISDASDVSQRLRITYEGIDFQNTGAGSSTTATSHLLDDYEEGTFTPTLGNTGTITAGTAEGKYTKIGNVCFARIRIDNATFGGSPNDEIRGLPFTAQQRSTTTQVVHANAFTAETIAGLVIQSQSYISMVRNSSTGSGFWSGNTIQTGTTMYIYCTLVYYTS